MEFVPNYITKDELFKVYLPVEFNLLFLFPSEARRHRAQIVKYRLTVFNTRVGKKSYRTLYVDDNNHRVFFTSKINPAAPFNITYFLDELSRINESI